ncbi:MAG: hypothetical protein U9R69_01370 [Thermodesulfobacteriota bacterium]|nr:hypothetical protein [Thermodesulfobacteriota bacterium]
MLPLKRSDEYKSRVRIYAQRLAKRYRLEIADAFISSVRSAEQLIHKNNQAGTDVPYILTEQQVVLKELYFVSGSAKYCLIYEILDDCVGLISLWHGMGSRSTDVMARIWRSTC